MQGQKPLKAVKEHRCGLRLRLLDGMGLFKSGGTVGPTDWAYDSTTGWQACRNLFESTEVEQLSSRSCNGEKISDVAESTWSDVDGESTQTINWIEGVDGVSKMIGVAGNSHIHVVCHC